MLLHVLHVFSFFPVIDLYSVKITSRKSGFGSREMHIFVIPTNHVEAAFLASENLRLMNFICNLVFRSKFLGRIIRLY